LLFLLTLLISEPSGVITTFSSTIIRNLGYNSKQSALLGMPSGVISILSTLACTFAILKGFPRWLSICILLVPAIIGGGLLSFLPKGAKGGLAGIYLINTCVAPLALIYSWLGGNVAGYTKKVGANAVIAIAFGIANIIGPQTFRAANAPQYLPAKITLFAVDGGAIVVAVLLRLLYGYRNRKTAVARAAQLEGLGEGHTSATDSSLTVDLTDGKNPAFQYKY